MTRTRLWLLRLIVAVAVARGCEPGFLHAQETPLTEFQLKAVFIYNFAKFVEWPADTFPDPKSPFVIGIIGEDPFGNYLEETVKNKFMNEHPFTVRHVRLLPDVVKCHILFVADSERKRLPEILNGIRGASVLTVSDLDRFLESGGIIRFYMEGNKVRFQINNDAAKRVGLKISSKLLRLGSRTEGEETK